MAIDPRAKSTVVVGLSDVLDNGLSQRHHGRMRTETTHKALFRLGWITAIAYLLIGIVVGVLPYHWREASVTDQVLWVIFIAGGGLLLIAGLRSIEHSPWLGATLVSVGGVAGAVPLFWTLVGPLAAIALIVLSIRAARRTRAAAT